MHPSLASLLAEAAEGHRRSADALARASRLAERTETGDPDPRLPHYEWPTGRTRRGNAALALSGAIAGATKIGKVWLARRSAIDAWIDAHATEQKTNDEAETEETATEPDEFASVVDAAARR